MSLKPLFCLLPLSLLVLSANAEEGLFAHFPLSNGAVEGQLINHVGHGDHEQKVAQVLSIPSGPGPTFKSAHGGYAHFEGMDLIRLPDLLKGRSEFSVSLWFRSQIEGEVAVILGASRGYNLSIGYDRGANGHLRWSHYTNAWQNQKSPLVSDEIPEPGIWHHVVVTSDGTLLRMYLNGHLQAGMYRTEGVIDPAGDEILGAYDVGHSQKWIGDIKELKGFSRVLQSEDVNQLYRQHASQLKEAAPVEVTRVKASGSHTDWKSGDEINYFKLVQSYLDTLMEHGRDKYGPEHSPLIAAALNRKTYRIGAFPGIEGIRMGDRITTGANPMTDQYIYKLMPYFTALTGDSKYAERTREVLAYFFGVAQSPVTSLYAWGEHMGWNFKSESEIERTHEFARPWGLWDLSFEVAPEASLRYATGLWEHQIGDHETGDFSRHAIWAKHDARTGMGFPRHGGFYIMTWAQAYAHSHDELYLKAIQTLVNHYYNGRSPVSGAVPADTSRDIQILWPVSTLSLSVDVHDAMKLLPPSMHESMQALNESMDEVFLQVNHQSEEPNEFFMKWADLTTLEPHRKSGRSSYARYWVTGYGEFLSAQVSNIVNLRYQQLPAGKVKEGYKQLMLTCADQYLRSEPNYEATLFPGAFGDVIWHLLDVYVLTADSKYLERAEYFAGIATEKFFTNGCPLPIASTGNDHYESITRGDTLMASLFRLHLVSHQMEVPKDFVYLDR